MTYSFSISGHADSEAAEWAVIQLMASAVQASGASSAYGSTQYHGTVDLTKVQTGTAVSPGGEPGTAPTPVLNAAGETIGYHVPPPDPAVVAAAALPAPVAAPVPAEAPPVTAETPGAVVNPAGEVVGTADPVAPAPVQEAAPLVDPAPQEPSLVPVYNQQGQLLRYVEA